MIRLTEEMRAAVDGALADGVPIAIAAVDADGQPSITFRGSTQALDGERLALWARNPEGGLVRSIRGNPRVALLYRHPGGASRCSSTVARTWRRTRRSRPPSTSDRPSRSGPATRSAAASPSWWSSTGSSSAAR